MELLNLAGGFPVERTLLVTAISRYQKTVHPNRPAIKLPTMELAKLTQSLFSQRQPRSVTFAVAKRGEICYTINDEIKRSHAPDEISEATKWPPENQG